MSKKIQQAFFIVRIKYWPNLVSSMRKIWFSIQGMKIGTDTRLPSIKVTWPHQVMIGKKCQLEAGTVFKYDGIWSEGFSIKIEDNVFLGSGCEFNINIGITIKQDANIASGCRFIDHDHGSVLGIRIGAQPSVRAAITIEEDVWLGVNVVVLKGVTIGSGSIVAAGAVVNRSIPENEIWGGVPAKFIKKRS